jgi:hypothetical protein
MFRCYSDKLYAPGGLSSGTNNFRVGENLGRPDSCCSIVDFLTLYHEALSCAHVADSRELRVL